MAREHARVLTRIWRDPEFRARTPHAQRAYVLLLTQRDVNYAGVLPLALARWARASEHTSVEDVELAVKELEDYRFVVIDRDTDEVLIRSFVRNDGLIEQPKVLRVAIREALTAESELVRSTLGAELARVELPEGKRGYDGIADALSRAVRTLGGPVPEPVAEPVAPPVPAPVDEPVDKPVSRDAGEPVVWDRSDGSGDGLSSRASARVGAGAVAVAGSVGGDLGGSRAREREAPRPADEQASGGPPPRSSTSASTSRPGRWPVQPCGQPHDPERGCRGCGDARERAETEAEQAATAERRAEGERRRACRACNDQGWLEHPVDGRPVVRCDHETDPQRQLADALDHAS